MLPGALSNSQCNLHTHSDLSNGAQPLQATINHDHSLGYDFHMISDHDVLADEAVYAKFQYFGPHGSKAWTEPFYRKAQS